MSKSDPLQPPIQGKRVYWNGLHGSAVSLAIQSTLEKCDTPVLIITPDNLTQYRLYHEMRYFQSDDKTLYLPFPDWETLPYDRFSPHQDIISTRLKTLAQLPTLKKGAIIIPASTLTQFIAPRDFILKHSFLLSVRDQINIDDFRIKLESIGYHRVPQVYEHGEYAIRGSIIDLFPMGSATPFRIELFDNDVESIRTFDSETQRSMTALPAIQLLPAREFPTNNEGITHFRQSFRENFSGNPMQCTVYTNTSEGIFTPGIEYYLPLFFESCETFLDYLPENTLIISVFDIQQAIQQFHIEVTERFEQRRYDISRPILPPEQLFLNAGKITEKLSRFPRAIISNEVTEHNPAKGYFEFSISQLPDLSIEHKEKIPISKLLSFLQTASQRIVITAETAGRREVLLNLLHEYGIRPKILENWDSFLESQERLCVTVGELNEGFILNDKNIAVITEAEIFGRQVLQHRRRKKTQVSVHQDAAIYNLAQLQLDAPLVHADHGVGRYMGLQTLTINDQTSEFLCLRYADDDKLYVPITSLHLISLYSGASVENAPLYKLGTKQWERAKEKAAKRVRDVAAELLDIYAKRAAKKGFAFAKPDAIYQQFANTFPFEETPDQLSAIENVLTDMQKPNPMDRLVCGDVGFGKTEVAMRAAFLATHNGKQVCVLVPTTLLAQQHFQTFSDRFADFPVQVDVLSRFRTTSEQQDVIKKLQTGTVDIVIGTHKLIQDDVKFKDLGLIIIDEEHRFGVRQKEHLKALRTEVDILTLTATPIPRTLNMALASIRDLSVIATPPAKRLSIKTFVHEYDMPLIRESILREIKRGGQVYFLHNEVATIHRIFDTLHDAIPEATIAIAHGQMHERELEKVMSDFYHHRFNVLICSTIIETGIDIPSANTIIINRADKFGLAQLHQLRGRVGRSHHQAYAYLLVPDMQALTADAEKRLEAIVTHEDLGIGFTLAMHDLEIRGAGELLGDSQSGNIEEVGFSLFNEMLENAVRALKKGGDTTPTTSTPSHTEIKCPITALIPETYMPDVNMRLQYYKRISCAPDKDYLDDIQAELTDCYGAIPLELNNLLRITHLKLLAQSAGILKIEMTPTHGRIDFNDKPHINPAVIIRLIQSKPQQFSMKGPQRLQFGFDKNTDDIIEWVYNLIKQLMSG